MEKRRKLLCTKRDGIDLLLSLNVDLSVAGAVAVLCLNVDSLLAPTGTAVTVFFVNSNVLFAELLTVVWSC